MTRTYFIVSELIEGTTIRNQQVFPITDEGLLKCRNHIKRLKEKNGGVDTFEEIDGCWLSSDGEYSIHIGTVEIEV